MATRTPISWTRFVTKYARTPYRPRAESRRATTLNSPSNGATDDDGQLTFEWEPVPGANRYSIVVASGPFFSSGSLVVAQVVHNTTSYTLSSPLPDGIWYWRVQAGNGLGYWSAWSESWHVQVQPGGALAAPVPVSPGWDEVVYDDQTPTFEWEPVAGANRYIVLVSTSLLFESGTVVMNQLVVGATSYTPGTPLPWGTYFWRAQAGDGAGGWSQWGEVHTFKVAYSGGMATPAVIWPTEGTLTTDTTSTFEWGAVTGAAKYFLLVYDAAGPPWNTLVIAEGVGNVTSWTPSTPLAPGTYYWFVNAGNGAGDWSAWYPPPSFTIE